MTPSEVVMAVAALRIENEQLRTALLEFIHAYANTEQLDRDGTEVKLFTAWVRGCAVLGIEAKGHTTSQRVKS